MGGNPILNVLAELARRYGAPPTPPLQPMDPSWSPVLRPQTPPVWPTPGGVTSVEK